uniref:BTB domain-containing protein n=1 Tax=Strongyloides stercoralis TaxID=6248 RepID=A0A0K0E8B8_STRER
MKVKTLSYLWEIPKSDLLAEERNVKKSPSFCDGSDQNFKCRLAADFFFSDSDSVSSFDSSIDSSSYSDSDSDFYKIFQLINTNIHFKITSKLGKEMYCNIGLCIINKERRRVNIREQVVKIKKVSDTVVFRKFFYSKFCYLNYKDIIFDGTLKILCTVNIFNKHDINSNLSNDHSKLSLSGFFNSSKLSDFTIIVDTIEIPVHKIVLSARSSVFDAMFNSDVSETQSNTLEIKDFQLEVVEEMLRYIYTDTYLNKVDIVTEVYMIADKYDIIGLKKVTENHLIKNTSVDNSCKYLVLADTYSNDTLKKYCLEFITTNAKEVIEKTDWKSFITKYPLLLESLFKTASKAEE